jgi:hypothetical protein
MGKYSYIISLNNRGEGENDPLLTQAIAEANYLGLKGIKIVEYAHDLDLIKNIEVLTFNTEDKECSTEVKIINDIKKMKNLSE